jgi:hypothetical protein
MSKFLKIAGIAALVVVVGVVALGAVAFAQEPPWKPPIPPRMPFHGPFGGGRGHGPDGMLGHSPDGPLGLSFEEAQAYREQMVEPLADALGMTTVELKAAIAEGQSPCQIVEAQGMDAAEVWDATESARQDLLQQAVEDELLTQRQADWISGRMANLNPGDWCDGDGPPGFFGGKRGHGPDGLSGHGRSGPMGANFEEVQAYREAIGGAFAEALGMSVKELEAAIAEGQTACEIIEAQGLDPAEVWETTADARQDLLQQAVADELLTQGQADWISQRMADHDASDLCSDDKWEMRPGFRGHGFQPGGFDIEGQGQP